MYNMSNSCYLKLQLTVCSNWLVSLSNDSQNLLLKTCLNMSTRNVCITKYARLYKLSNGIMVMTPKYIGFFPFHRGIMWPSLVKIQYTELKLLCGNLCGRPPARHTQSHNTASSQDGRIKIAQLALNNNHSLTKKRVDASLAAIVW